MSRERWLIGIAALVVIVGVVLYGAVLVSNRNRDAAVAKLKVRGAAAAARHRPAPDSVKAQPGSTSGQAAKKLPLYSAEDTVAAFMRLIERRKSIDDDTAQSEALEIVKYKPPKEWSADDRTKAAEFLAANQDLIREIIRLADAGGPLYELDCSNGIFGMQLPHLAPLLDCVRLLTGGAAFCAGEGDYTEAAEYILAAMKLAGVLQDEPIMNSQCYRTNMDRIMIAAVEQSIPGENLPPDLAGKIIEYAAHAAGREEFADAVNADGYFCLEAFDLTRSGDLARTGFIQPTHFDRDSVLWQLYGSAIASPWLNADEQTYAEIMTRMSDVARLPFCEAKPLLDQIRQDIDSLPTARFLSRTLLSDSTTAIEAQAQHEAQLDLMRLGLAVEQYHARTGAYPESLDAIVSTVGGSVPLDPFTGKPYVYQRSGTTFELYSAMGSAIDLSGSANRRGADANGNYVWRGRH